MRVFRASRFAAALALVLLGGCAAAGLTPVTPNQPVARQQMRPEYRVFYDALQDEGEWVLIEPVGWVFRPRVVIDQWSPYQYGFWAPSDEYGWVWISSEGFGWATYHYGQWFWDSYQGWVWVPGLDWAPAWATWQVAGEYVGWGPAPVRGALAASLKSAGAGSGAPPPTAMHYAPMTALGSTNLQARIVAPSQMGIAIHEARPLHNAGEHDGVTFERGPALGVVERIAGTLPRVKVEDLVPGDLGRRLAAPREAARGGAAATDDPVAIAKQAGTRAAEDARRLAGIPGPAAGSVLFVRPVLSAADLGPADRGGARRAPARGRTGAAADSTR